MTVSSKTSNTLLQSAQRAIPGALLWWQFGHSTFAGASMDALSYGAFLMIRHGAAVVGAVHGSAGATAVQIAFAIDDHRRIDRENVAWPAEKSDTASSMAKDAAVSTAIPASTESTLRSIGVV
jgi:hypothetical protein